MTFFGTLDQAKPLTLQGGNLDLEGATIVNAHGFVINDGSNCNFIANGLSFISEGTEAIEFQIGTLLAINVGTNGIIMDVGIEGGYQFNANGTTAFSSAPGQETVIGAIPSDDYPDVGIRLVAQGTGKVLFDAPLDCGKINSRDEALPVAGESLRGMIRTVEGGTGAADVHYICLKNSNGTYSWKQIASGTV